MRRFFLILLPALLAAVPSRAYSDHRGWNVDSLERVVAAWTPERIARATDKEFGTLLDAQEGLMMGYLQIDGPRSEHYARELLRNARSRDYLRAVVSAEKILGQIYWAQEVWDSAKVHYGAALEAVERMAAGQGRSSRAEGFDERTVDDARSGLYGAIGNLYNLMDSLPQAMEYYAKAGEIFEKYGWNESNAILWYNLGETWLEEGDLRQAEDCYRKSLDYARASGDSLQISSPLKGLGSLYLKQGKTRKALRCLKEADRYYSLHQDQEFRARLETLDVMSQVLTEQKRTRSLVALAAIILLLLLLAMQFLLRRLRILQQEKQGADAVIDEVLSSLGPDPDETVSPAVAAPVSPAVPATPSAWAEPRESPGLFLSEREREVLTLIAAGLTSPQIAEHLYLSLPTIKWYRKRLLSKFGASNMADLVRRAKEEGII